MTTGRDGGAGAAGSRDIFLVSNSVDETGGVTSWSHHLARLLTERGHRLHVIGITTPEDPHDLGELPYPTTRLYDGQPPAPGRARVASMRERAAVLSGLFRAARPGGVVVVTQVWAMEWVALADTSGLTVIGMSHESFETSRRSSRFRRVLKHYRDVDRMLVLTREDADLWIGEGLDNASYLPNAVPWLPEEPSPRTGKAVLSIGRLSDEKGVDMLLDTWAEVATRHPDWTLLVYGSGSGEDEQLLRKQCTALGLDGSVSWMGRTHDVQGALRGGSVFALSSRGEGFPLALMEAMAMGVPCVAFDCAPGVHEIVRDGEDGLLATPGNTGELARRLDELITDKALRDRMGDRARENIRRYGTQEIVDRWEALFTFLER
ncbi:MULTISPECIES: glycosyltransferase [Streptomyces]|uniref:D-inositol 3-phosphate glycosyltransferase n=1 Tax=Streptomyces griseiscabiei TaxID=2993540 RepID=A0ABU4KZ93_9ACTN|nr:MULTISPECIES: glycosyltransferase [Streptomyces]MDX2908658.1 glycosyltransferase [Streptomyces griseiscabiei]